MKQGMIGGFEEAIETGQGALSKGTKQAVKDFTSSVKGQLTGSGSTPSDQGTNEQASAQKQKMSDDAAKQFLKDLYGASTMSSQKSEKPQSHPISEALGLPQADPNAGKTQEEVAKINSLRAQLHGDYYHDLVSPQKTKEKPVTEKLEEEKKMEELELAKSQEKIPGPLQNVKRGTGETNVGIAG